MAIILSLGHAIHSDENSVLVNVSGGHTRHGPGPNPALYEPGGHARQILVTRVCDRRRVQGCVSGPR